METINGLYIEMTSEKLLGILTGKVDYHTEKAVWYRDQATSVKQGITEEANHSNNPYQSLKQSQKSHEQKATFFGLLADNIIPDTKYRLSQEDCMRLELYDRYM